MLVSVSPFSVRYHNQVGEWIIKAEAPIPGGHFIVKYVPPLCTVHATDHNVSYQGSPLVIPPRTIMRICKDGDQYREFRHSDVTRFAQYDDDED